MGVHLSADIGLFADHHGLQQQRVNKTNALGQGLKISIMRDSRKHRVQIMQSMANFIDGFGFVFGQMAGFIHGFFF